MPQALRCANSSRLRKGFPPTALLHRKSLVDEVFPTCVYTVAYKGGKLEILRSPQYIGEGWGGVIQGFLQEVYYTKSRVNELFTYLKLVCKQSLYLLLIRGKAPGSLFYPLNKANQIIHRRMSKQEVLRALRRHGEKADVEAFTPDDFRRTFIGNLLDAGADIVTVAKLAGYASPNTTSKYDTRGEAAKKRAIDLLNVLYNRRKNG